MAKLKATPKNFVEAQQILGTKSSVRLGNNTYLERVEESESFNLMIVVRLHKTNIVQFHSDGRVTLHSGGWFSVTTKDRINQFISGRIVQRNYEWFFVTNRGELGLDWANPKKFVEGMNAV